MDKKIVVNESLVISKIYMIRGHKVMLDEDLAEMYGTETRSLNQQIKRNADRFPEDFMFQLTSDEYELLTSQNATSNWGGRRKLPNAFTEHGVLMLSSVLDSQTAVQVNIKIMRVYTNLREMLLANKDILLKLEQLEKQVSQNSKEIQVVFSALKQLLETPKEPREPIGYKSKKD